MKENAQDEVISFLSSSDDHREMDHVETHGAHIFLSGDTALKVKKAVRYDYLDYSSLAKREKMLWRELELNQPAAPQIYRDVVPITRDTDTLALDGTGEPVEWALRMKRFPRENELSAVAERGELDDALAEDLGTAIADYHASAPQRQGDGADRIRAILEELERAFASMHDELGAKRVKEFSRSIWTELENVAPLLRSRSEAGHLRRCHGDLHLRNLVLIDGKPVPFDALEFDEELGTCDVLYDLAFLVMDLLHSGLDRQANIVLNRWLFANSGREDAGLAALPVFVALRAGIRAMVTVQTGSDERQKVQTEAQEYLGTAIRAVKTSKPRLLAIGGLSGTGKSTIARLLAPGLGRLPGAVHLRSDLERKALAGVATSEALPKRSYTPASGNEVYQRLIERAATLLVAGHTVLLDATFHSPSDRLRPRALADSLNLPFTGLWLDAPAEVLMARVEHRQGDASDADAAVVREQMKKDAGTIEWLRIDATGQADRVAEVAGERIDLNRSNELLSE